MKLNICAAIVLAELSALSRRILQNAVVLCNLFVWNIICNVWRMHTHGMHACLTGQLRMGDFFFFVTTNKPLKHSILSNIKRVFSLFLPLYPFPGVMFGILQCCLVTLPIWFILTFLCYSSILFMLKACRCSYFPILHTSYSFSMWLFTVLVYSNLDLYAVDSYLLTKCMKNSQKANKMYNSALLLK